MNELNPALLPDDPGTYVLWLDVVTPLRVTVGRLGEYVIAAGVYAYVGSARGPGGLRARLGRHLRADKKPHWHIDALTTRVPVVAIWLVRAPQSLECDWARALAGLAGVETPIHRFGASDCDCPAHLFRLAPDSLPLAWRALGQPERVTHDPRFMFSV